MFNKDFYPTPDEVSDSMDIDCFGKVVLEPHGGSGNLIDYLKNKGAKTVLSCEINEKLAKITQSKCDEFITYDFLSVVSEQISHIDMIVMNPPFSTAAEQITHAWEIAPEGCEIITLVNFSSVNGYTSGRYREVSKLINNYGHLTNLGEVFSNGAERTTNAEIGLIKLYKPMISEGSNFEGFYMDDDDAGEDGLMKANKIHHIVGLYKQSLQRVDAVFSAGKILTESSGFFGTGAVGVSMHTQRGDREVIMNKEVFAVSLQKSAWKKIFAKLDMERFVTSQVMKDINKFCERQNNVPFTVRNIRKMFDILVGTQDAIFNRSLVEAIDNFTRHTHENRFGVEGWKTNDGHLLSKKFIVNNVVERCYSSRFSLKYGYARDKINDLNKVLCRLTGTNFKSIRELRSVFEYGGESTKGIEKFEYKKEYKKGDRVLDSRGGLYILEVDSFTSSGFGDEPRRSKGWIKPELYRSTWYDWGFFRFKFYNKGTMHLEFKTKSDWETLNRKYAEIKGQVLPEKI